MKPKTKRFTIGGLSALCALTLAAGVGTLANKTTFVDAATEQTTNDYYYLNLKDTDDKDYALAKKFYEALDKMNKDGDFKDGKVEFSLGNTVTSAEIKKWVEDGDLTIPKAFSAARDSYFYDHPELFYVDLYKLTISAGRTGGVYSAYIDSGREANCYIDGGFKNATEVETAISAFNAKVDKIAAEAKKEAAKDTVGTAEDVLLANYVNEYIAENTSYDFEAYSLADTTNGYAKPYTGNAYGGLVLGECVCSGYSTSYKAVLDKLGVPCIIVSGTSIKKNTDGSSTDKGEAHSWNYVWLETPADDKKSAAADGDKTGSWYAYDVTWNSTAAAPKGEAALKGNANSYVSMSAFAAARNHLPDPVISTSGYKMPYPVLSMNNYGATTVDNEFMHSYTYKNDTSAGNDGKDDYGNPLKTKEEIVSYKGKSATALLKENLHILYRYYYENDDGVKSWTNWADLGATDTILQGGLDMGNATKVPTASNALYSQYAVVDIGPDLTLFGKPDSEGDGILVNYSPDFKDENGKDLGYHMLYISEVYVNKTYGTYMAAPYITTTNPKHTEVVIISTNMAISEENTEMDDKYAFTMNVTYDEKLREIDKDEDIGISFVSEYQNIYEHAFLIPFEDDGKYVHLSDDGYTLSFRFKPSLLFEHNSILYSFYFDNVGSTRMLNGRESLKAPNPVHYHFARTYMACPMIFGDGRLWVDCCAQPTLVSNSDLAAMDFKDEDGNSTFSEQARSQMMLVVESVDEKVENAMLDGIEENFGFTNDDIQKSETYDIALQICGRHPTIPDGSYVKIALGFPQGYGPDDEGVTFKLYHRKHIQDEEYIIEEVPCVVTKFGIVATVTSFSPYMVAAVDSDKVTSTDKYIYATIDGKGGTLSKEDGQIKTVKEGKSVTYTIVPDSGYMIYTVTLNGVDVKSKVTEDGILTLSYGELADNSEVEIKYIAIEAAQRYVKNGIEEPVKTVVTTDGVANKVEGTGGKVELDVPELPDDNTGNGGNTSDIGNGGSDIGGNLGGDKTDDDNSNVLPIVVVSVAAVAVIAAAVIAIIIVMRKRRNED